MLDGQLAAGNLAPLKAALRDRLWQYGAAREPAELVRSLCGGSFDPAHYTDYLRRKYTDLYEL